MKELHFTKELGEIKVIEIGHVKGMEAVHQWLDRNVKYITNGQYSLTITRVTKKRSLNQNRLMWMWFACMEDSTGQPKQDFHDYYCSKFLGRDIVVRSSGEIERVCSGTHNLNTAQMSRFLDQVKADAQVEFGIALPLPSDLGYEEFALEYGRMV